MLPIWIASFGALIFSVFVNYAIPYETNRIAAEKTDVLATNFIAYREAVTKYYYANPSATGTIADAQLNFDPGYIRNNLWSNQIQAKVVYVYGSTTGDVLTSLYQKSQNSTMVGTNSGSVLINAVGGSTGIALPAGIPAGSIVFVGQ